MQKCFTQNFSGKNTTFLYFSMLYPIFNPAKVPPQSCIFATLKPSKTTKTPSEPHFTIPHFVTPSVTPSVTPTAILNFLRPFQIPPFYLPNTFKNTSKTTH